MAILRLTQQEDNNLEEIVKTILSDPSLTGRVLKVANSSRSGAATPIVTLEDAVMRLGFQTLRNLALGFSLLSSNPKVVCEAFDYQGFWYESLGRGVAAQQLSESADKGSPAECYICGLLASMGRLALAYVHPEPYSRVLQQIKPGTSEDLIAIEGREFGVSHRELTEAMLLDWGFPREVARAAAIYPQPQSGQRQGDSNTLRNLAATLRLADGITTTLNQGGFGGGVPDDFRQQLVELGVPADNIEPLLDSIRKSWADWSKTLNLDPAKQEVAGLPASLNAEKSSGSAPGSSAAGSRDDLKVLVLDADEPSRRKLEGWLAANGCRLIHAAQLKDALVQIVSQPPQIILARGKTNDAEALELCKAIRKFEAGRAIYFLLATRQQDAKALAPAYAAGIDDYLVLPYECSNVITRFRAARRTLQLQATVSAQEKMLQQQISELAVLNRKLHLAALTDPLTQLPNRRYAEERLREEWTHSAQSGAPLSVLAADLDHFKKVNDTHGHMVGDVLLTEIARLFREQLRGEDIACRIGGEEFLVICPGTDEAGARACGERLRAAVEANEILVSGSRHKVTISLGVATRQPQLDSANALLKAADDASYASKRAGRNRVTCVPIPGSQMAA